MIKIKGRVLLTCLCFVFCLFSAQAEWIMWDVNTAIPDNDETGLQDTRTVSGFTDVIQLIDVRLRLTGDPLAFDGDFFASLLFEHGGYAVLLNRIGRTTIEPLGYDSSGFDVQFTVGGNDIHLSQNFSPTYDGDGRLTGTWGIDGRNVDPDVVLDTSPRLDMLSSFHGMNPNGNWTLFVADMSLYDKATLDSWGLNIQAVPEPATVLLLSLGGFGAWLLRRNGRTSKE